MIDYDKLVPSGFFSVRLPASIMTDLSLVITVKDNSMADFEIYPGDEVMVRLQSSFRNGDTVLCVIDDRVTVKTWYRGRGGKLWFLSRDKKVKPILASDCACFIVGIVSKVTQCCNPYWDLHGETFANRKVQRYAPLSAFRSRVLWNHVSRGKYPQSNIGLYPCRKSNRRQKPFNQFKDNIEKAA